MDNLRTPAEYEDSYYLTDKKPQVAVNIWSLHQTRNGSKCY